MCIRDSNGSDLYVIPATTGAALTALAVGTGLWGPAASILIPTFVFAFRMLAWRMQWRVPAPMRGWTVRGIDVRRRREDSVFGRPGRGDDDDEGGGGDGGAPGSRR